MKTTNLPDLLGFTVALMGTVGFFVISNAPEDVGSPKPSPEVIRKSSSRVLGSGNGSDSKLQTSITPGTRRAEAVTSRSDASPPPMTGSRKAADISSIAKENRSQLSGSRSGSSGEALAVRMPNEHQAATGQSTFPSVDDDLSAQPARISHEAQAREIGEPLIFTDPGSLVSDEPGRDAALQEAADQLARDLVATGLPPDSPEYLAHWNRTVDLSNQLLRQRYGGQVWLAHHIQSRHLRAASGDQD